MNLLPKEDNTPTSKDIISLFQMAVSILTEISSAKIRVAEHRVEGYSALADPFKIVWVSPKIINKYPVHTVNQSYRIASNGTAGAVIGGDWDAEKNLHNITEHKKYRAIEQHYFEGAAWDETGIIDWYIENKKLSKTDESPDEIRKKYEKYYRSLDETYKDIKKNGYNMDKIGPLDHISVHISRDGELLFASRGWHRLSIAKLLELSEIPVLIRARHKHWQRIRELASDNPNGCEMVATHPDLEPFR